MKKVWLNIVIYNQQIKHSRYAKDFSNINNWYSYYPIYQFCMTGNRWVYANSPIFYTAIENKKPYVPNLNWLSPEAFKSLAFSNYVNSTLYGK